MATRNIEMLDITIIDRIKSNLPRPLFDSLVYCTQHWKDLQINMANGYHGNFIRVYMVSTDSMIDAIIRESCDITLEFIPLSNEQIVIQGGKRKHSHKLTTFNGPLLYALILFLGSFIEKGITIEYIDIIHRTSNNLVCHNALTRV